MTPAEISAYLLSEHRDLSERHRSLQRDFAALRAAKFSREQWAAYRQKLSDHRQRLANHRLAVEWARYPPVGRPQRLSALSSAIRVVENAA